MGCKDEIMETIGEEETEPYLVLGDEQLSYLDWK